MHIFVTFISYSVNSYHKCTDTAICLIIIN